VLHLNGCVGVRDLRPLASLEKLEALDLDDCAGLTDLAPLEGLPSLKRLFLRGCDKVSEAQVERLRKRPGLSILRRRVGADHQDIRDLERTLDLHDRP